MFTRRAFSATLATCLAGGAFATPARAERRLADDGLYQFDWYLESQLNLPADHAAALAAGKRLAILIGQRGCPYCKYMAERHLEDEATVSYIRENFEVVNLNLFGAREVTDFDGRAMSERQFGRAYGVRLTPSILFLPERADGLAARPPADRPSIRMPGLMKQPEFLGMFRYVREKGYESASFKQWLTTQQG
ncbi:MAG: thioredoxin family protein [Beijerinckiaceae bacterium]|nr:thioredoxin family protein [Beijerinckiaceae bacterium]